MVSAFDRQCAVCGGIFSYAENEIRHSIKCPHNPEKQRRGLMQGVDNVSSIGAARFTRAHHPGQTPAMDAIEGLKKFLSDNPDQQPDHVVICIGKDTGGGATAVRFFQAGLFNSLEQFGLLWQTLALMQQTGAYKP